MAARNRPRSNSYSGHFRLVHRRQEAQLQAEIQIRSREKQEIVVLLPRDRRELLLPPEAVVDVLSTVPDTTSFKVDRSIDRDFDRKVSLPRLSSGSSYAGSLFSGTTTLDGNFSGDVKESSVTTRPAEEEVEEEVRERSRE
ncbi:hypothetical protein ACLB2K_049247 [Fragaria x ananassa]